MTANTNSNSAREAALARRRAMSTQGKAAIGGSSASAGRSAPASDATAASGTRAPAARPTTTPGGSARAASRARRQAMSVRGKAGVTTADRTRDVPAPGTPRPTVATPAAQEKSGCGCGCQGEGSNRAETRETQATASTSRPKVNPKLLAKAAARNISTTRAAALARRQAMSTRGKAGVSKNGMSAAQTARAANPNLSSRELAQALREQRSKNGKAGEKKAEPVGRMRPGKREAGPAEDQPWKVGVSETAHGQSVTGTMVGRSKKTTGDEPSTCRSVTGTEYLGADIFREFCQAEPGKGPGKVRVSPTGHGNRVTGNEVGRSERVTGDEPGTCKRVTGSEYVSPSQTEQFCGTKPEPGPLKITGSETRKGKGVTGNNVGRSGKVTGDETGAGRELTGTQYMKKGDGQAPAKVGTSQTLRGGSVTGTMVGRGERVTGDEPGSCRNVTGDDYVGQEQYSGFCAKTPDPQDRKVGVSQTFKGRPVSGTLTGRGERVTGDEPGTCKAITGTPYAGAEQYRNYCKPEETNLAAARTREQRATPGSVMTGIQPGINGRTTGAQKGACEPVSGTPYVGADQFAAACPSVPAEPGSPDFPQPLEGAPWGQFSVSAPVHAAQTEAVRSSVTGSSYEKGSITGPFGMATGKVTGTEDARFGRGNAATVVEPPLPETAAEVDGRVKGRITGEGMEGGLKITGDDWDRGDRVTGTEGMSAVRRNPTRRGGPMSSAMQPPKRNEEVPAPVSKVTGGSGNTEKGSLITYSGGARG